MGCKHESPQWQLADCNEDGWKCIECDASLGDDGFSPQHDRLLTSEKVSAILLYLHECKFMYVSNATMGDGMIAAVVQRCHDADTFDQLSIIKWLIEASSTTHAEFWRLQAKQAMCSHPSRTLAGDVATCNACGHEAKQQVALGLLFDNAEPF